MIKLSVVIPLFNADKYIGRCVHSIMNQFDLKFPFEVIIINDGSTDESSSVIRDLRKQYSRLIIIDQENKGVSTARNVGLRSAKGEYVFFADADDFILTGTLSTALKIAESSKAEAVGFSFLFSRDGVQKKVSRGKEVQQNLSGIEWARAYIHDWYYTHSFIFKREVILKKNLWFNPKVTVWEDVLFLCQFFCLSNAVYFSDHAFYQYHFYSDSLSQKRVYRTPANRFYILISFIHFYFTRRLDKAQRKYIRNRISLCFVLLTDTLTRYVFSKWLSKIKDRINARM